MQKGQLPSEGNLAALIVAVLYSDRLAPQVEKDNHTMFFPIGYKSDRKLAQETVSQMETRL
jgi:hypothetical protein